MNNINIYRLSILMEVKRRSPK